MSCNKDGHNLPLTQCLQYHTVLSLNFVETSLISNHLSEILNRKFGQADFEWKCLAEINTSSSM